MVFFINVYNIWRHYYKYKWTFNVYTWSFSKNCKDTFTIIDNRYNKYYYDITVRR